MPKRKKSTSVEDDLATLLHKVRKLEEKIRNNGSSTSEQESSERRSSFDLDNNQAITETPAQTLEVEDWPLETGAYVDVFEDMHPFQPELVPHVTMETEPPLQITVDTEPSVVNKTPGTSTEPPTVNETSSTSTDHQEDSLGTEVLEILGVDPSSSTKFCAAIRDELATRLQYWATEGLSKEARKDLLDKYLLPSNALQLGAPQVNAEIKAAIASNAATRDKGIETKQRQMASALSCLADVINTQITSKDINNEQLQKLMDVARLLCDLQHADSVTRRNFILTSVKRDLKDHLSKTKIDTSLFGTDLPETLKTAKTVNKVGCDLKTDASSFKGNYRRVPPKLTAPKHLNRRAAPARRPPGAQTLVQYRQPAPAWPATWPQQTFMPPPPPPPLQSHPPLLRPSSRQAQGRRRQN